jgi:hypothetical protein
MGDKDKTRAREWLWMHVDERTCNSRNVSHWTAGSRRQKHACIPIPSHRHLTLTWMNNWSTNQLLLRVCNTVFVPSSLPAFDCNWLFHSLLLSHILWYTHILSLTSSGFSPLSGTAYSLSFHSSLILSPTPSCWSFAARKEERGENTPFSSPELVCYFVRIWSDHTALRISTSFSWTSLSWSTFSSIAVAAAAGESGHSSAPDFSLIEAVLHRFADCVFLSLCYFCRTAGGIPSKKDTSNCSRQSQEEIIIFIPFSFLTASNDYLPFFPSSPRTYTLCLQSNGWLLFHCKNTIQSVTTRARHRCTSNEYNP